MLADLPRRLLLSLALTLLLEGAFARLCRVRGRRNACLVLLVNLLTNPPVALVGNLFPFWPVHLALEAAAVLVEGAEFIQHIGLAQAELPVALLAAEDGDGDVELV